jgi:hypothetical protein
MTCSIRISFARRTISVAIIQQRRPANSNNKNNNVRRMSETCIRGFVSPHHFKRMRIACCWELQWALPDFKKICAARAPKLLSDDIVSIDRSCTCDMSVVIDPAFARVTIASSDTRIAANKHQPNI